MILFIEVLMRFYLFITFVMAAILISCSTASNKITGTTPVKAANIERYGEDTLKIWTPLMPIEMGALMKAKDDLDHVTQVVLSLFLTGEVKDQQEINVALNAYSGFIELCDKELCAITDIKKKGKKLHELFFKQFIGSFRTGSVSSGTSGLLTNREFDTNTATLLFAIIAGKYGFSAKISVVEGAVTEIKSQRTGLSINVFSGKSYLELTHKNIYSSVQVFPYLENGYDPYINLGFFENLCKLNPEVFNEPEVEFKKYYKRKPLSFEEALLLQYKIDKTAEVIDLEFAPINKRIEMAAVLTDSCEVLIDRVWAWRNIYSFLLEKKVFGEKIAFLDIINTELERAGELCENEPEFAESVWDLFLFSAFEYANAVDGAKLKGSIRNGYKFLSTASKDYGNKKLGLANSVNYYINKVIENGVIENELANVKGVIGVILESKTRIDAASSFYYQAGEYYLKKKDLWRAGQFYADCAFIEENQYKSSCIQKGGTALYDYAVESMKKGVCATVADARNKCMEKIPDKYMCERIKVLYDRNCR